MSPTPPEDDEQDAIVMAGRVIPTVNQDMPFSEIYDVCQASHFVV
jgi:hypothetical protein